MSRVKAAFFTNGAANIDYVYAQGRREKIAELTDLYPVIINKDNFAEHLPQLADLEVIFSTWGMLPLTTAEIAKMPKLKVLFYGAGATDGFARPFLQSGVAVVSAWQANAIPVAEFCVAQILLGMKGYFRNSRELTCREMFNRSGPGFAGPGSYGETVALIGAGAIAAKTKELLAPYHLNVEIIPSRIERRTMSLEEAFEKAFVVSNHLPNREDNQKVIRGEHFRLMRPGATFINTGRGAQVDEAEMIAVLKERTDLTVLLDVTHPEPPENGSELYTLPNVHLSAHIAGSINDEVVRMADYVIEDFQRWQKDEPMLYRVDESMLMTS